MEVIISFLLTTNLGFSYKLIKEITAFNFRLKKLESSRIQHYKILSKLEKAVFPSDFDELEYSA